jgi:AcrR family transcriptional regulator
VSSEAILAEARRLLAAEGVTAFSVRELAKALGIVPGTIQARFGNKHELLAALYLQRIDEALVVVDGLPDQIGGVGRLLDAIAPSLSTLRREFVLHFEGDRSGSGPDLRPETWDALSRSFGRLSDRLYAAFRAAAAAEGVDVVDGSRARRLVWTAASTLDSPRGSRAFHHGDAGYRRFVASSLLRALATSG